jgi:glycosyltransferase involved in cell wall biosynthesis
LTTNTRDTHELAATDHIDSPEVSIVIPCLNEAETLESVITEIQAAARKSGLSAEVLVADNGSSDGSPDIAARLGARVVSVVERGYGSALRGGIIAARGKYVVMGDADGSYDFSSIESFVVKLRAGNDLVIGNRFKGGIKPGAMPWKNRWIGTPVLSALLRLFFDSDIRDVNCGLRGFTKSAFVRMNLQTTGMEFASEMLVKASLMKLRVAEVPTVLRPDGRSRKPHMRPWRDGWRHLRFMLLYSPGWLFFAPGAAMFVVGVLGSIVLIRGPVHVGGTVFDIHTLLVTAFLTILGYQVIVFAVSTRTFATQAGLLPASPLLMRLYRYVRLETGLVAGGLATLLGLAGLALAFIGWSHVGFERLDPRVTMRELIPAVVLVALGVQTVFASFFLSMMGMSRSDRVHLEEVHRDRS